MAVLVAPVIDHARYLCGELLGRGAQGVVLRVTDREAPHRPLVAKMTAGSLSDLAGEFALLSRLRVPGLVRVHDFAADAKGVPFLVEEFVDGVAPTAWVESDAARLVSLGVSLAETLGALHDAGFVHGDVKPANVRVGTGGRVVLVDLGAAQALGAARARVLTPAFAAPERNAGAPASVASDLYSLGATLWASATAAPPGPRATALRDLAPWIPPSVATVIEALLAPHPGDRPRSGVDVVGALGRSVVRGAWESAGRSAHVREAEVVRLLGAAKKVIYLTGPSGVGKSHVVREVVTRALLAGREARHLRFPLEDAAFTQRLVAWLRGEARAAPWHHDVGSLLLVLDDVHEAPAEIVEALDVYRCRMHEAGVTIILTAREAPPGADTVPLDGLDAASFAALCEELSASTTLYTESGGLPGWAVAAVGRVPLTREAALARVRDLEPAAREALAIVATLGGWVPATLLDASTCGSAFVAGLLARERERIRLGSPRLARDLADALSSLAVSDRAADLALGSADVTAASLLAAGGASAPPARRLELLVRAAELARRDGLRAIEIEALVALAASPAERTLPRLARLERLTRDAGTARAHPQVLTWLEEAATRDASWIPLAARRRAEERARAGEHEAALRHAVESVARAEGSPLEHAYALATKGAVHLFAADWAGAAHAFEAAGALLAVPLATEPEGVDREEVARLEHNAGVVALYRGELVEAASAFERAVVIKRALGDRAGIRACLLNLGLALARQGRHDEAEATLVEATALAATLGQAAGRAWCLAARADLAVRRGRARDAEQLVAEASASGDAIPAAVRADLVLLRAEIALLEGDGRGALNQVASLDASLRASDALIDARAYSLEGRGHLSLLPARRRDAARAAVRAIRAARARGLVDAAAEATLVLRQARGMTAVPPPTTAAPGDAWEVLAALARAPDATTAMALLAALILSDARGERAIVATLDPGGRATRAWGLDVDGLALAQADERLDAASVEAARRAGSFVYQPDVATRAGRGSRLVVAGTRTAVAVEHRFVRAAFDHVDEAMVGRWSVLADLAARLVMPTAESASPTAPAVEAPEIESTAAPRRAVVRDFPELLGRSVTLRRALTQLDAATDTELPVVIRGETGTGKELFARALHDHGARRDRPFVAINCAAIADSLFEAELFGHARGAFTGAERARLGLLGRAEGGTLLLDEVGELPLARQATLLRVLESRRFRAVGADDERPFDVRIIAATNRDLDAAVQEGAFRRDLLYRLRVLEIVVPPLREREGDIAILLAHFLKKAGSAATPSMEALEALDAYTFPGNVRELLHVAQRLAAAGVTRIEVAHLPRAVRGASASSAVSKESRTAPRSVPEEERSEVQTALARTGGNISRAATLLGLTRHGLKKRMLRLGLRAKAEEA